jgi:hypothetical protein
MFFPSLPWFPSFSPMLADLPGHRVHRKKTPTATKHARMPGLTTIKGVTAYLLDGDRCAW